MSSISYVKNSIANREVKSGYGGVQKLSVKDYILLLPFFLVFIGDFQIGVGTSSITVPMSMAIILPIFLGYLVAGKLKFSRVPLLLFGVLFCGLLGFLFTPAASFLRTIAGSLPVLFSMLTVMIYEQYQLPCERAIKYILVGSFTLAIAVIILFLISRSIAGGYYDQKLLIETPLGRSNYLAAFLLFAFALSLPVSTSASIVILVAIFCTLSRGGVLALILFFATSLLLRVRRLWFYGCCIGLLLISVMLIFYSVPEDIIEYILQFLNLQDVDVNLDSVYSRLDLWSFGFDIFSENPVFGIGPNTFRTFIEMDGSIEDVWGVHNSLLLVLLNYGFFGLICYFAYIVIIYKQVLIAERKNSNMFYLRCVFLVLMFFGFYEPLVGSAAFEMLLVLTYILAKSQSYTSIRL